MSKFRVRFALILAGIGAASALVASPPSHADGTLTGAEQIYGDTFGVSFICNSWDEDGMTPVNLASTAMAVANVGGFTADNAGDVVLYATQTYCPQYMPKLREVVAWAKSQQRLQHA